MIFRATILSVAVASSFTPLQRLPLDALLAARRHPSLRLAADDSSALKERATRFEGQLAQFAPRSSLQEVREECAVLQKKLAGAIDREDYISAAQLRDQLTEARGKDPAVMAATLRDELQARVAHEQYGDAARCRDELLVLRRFLPQYQLAGLWKGNYPNHGDELVRLHYAGDMLYATKVTGDEHVPAGEVTFRADLSTAISSDHSGERAPSAASQFWGGDEAVGVKVEVLSLSADGKHEPREVETFDGEGRIAARGFRQPHFVPGQLFLMDDDVVGFLWLPIGTFVVFSRVPEKEEPLSP